MPAMAWASQGRDCGQGGRVCCSDSTVCAFPNPGGAIASFIA